MAWISVHEQLKDHRKVRELARQLGCNRHEALGILITLWLWGINNADRDGDLGSAAADDIADGVMYRSLCASQFANCLVNSGWIDEKPDGGYALHDWDTWQEAWFKALDRREQSKALMRKLRNEQKSVYVSKQLAQPLTECEHNVSTSPSPKPSPKPSYKNNQETPPPAPPPGERRVRSSQQEPERFATFWNCYPRKVAKPVALKAWMKLDPDEDLFKAIIAGLSRAKLSEQWQKDGGAYVPHPATFLNQRRWEDEQPTKAQEVSLYERF